MVEIFNDSIPTGTDEGSKNEVTQLITLSKTPDLIPPFTSITKLDLFQANLSTLPTSLPEHLPNLSILFCMKNNFEVVPGIIGKCPKLQMVSFKSNKITTIEPDALQEQMRWLILTDNKISALPSTIGRCTRLQKCMLSGNLLTELPSEISKCTSLELIRLASNKLVDPPLELLRLPRLSWVALSDNPFLTKSPDIDLDEHKLDINPDPRLDDPNEALFELGRGASGITRRYTLTDRKEDVAIKEYYSNVTSDGNPQEERLISMIASSLGCPSLVKVLGQTNKGNLIMQLLTDYKVFANPPSLQSCSRDCYDDCSLSSEQASSMVNQLLYTLMKLHEKGITHGDFYGHNILLSTKREDSHVWLTDFGAAFFYDPNTEFGGLIQLVERRAFSHLVSEIADLVDVRNDGDVKAKLYEFSKMCVEFNFEELYEKFLEEHFTLGKIK